MSKDIIEDFDNQEIDNLKIKIQKIKSIEGCLLFHLTGTIDTFNSEQFNNKINMLIDQGFIKLIFHCGNIDYISSTGIGSFTSFLESVTKKDGEIVIINLQSKNYQIFQNLGFTSFFEFGDNLEDAIAFINK